MTKKAKFCAFWGTSTLTYGLVSLSLGNIPALLPTITGVLCIAVGCLGWDE